MSDGNRDKRGNLRMGNLRIVEAEETTPFVLFLCHVKGAELKNVGYREKGQLD